MRSARRLLLGFVSFIVIAFGLLSVHYTIFDGVEHHREWAREHGMPEPSRGIFYLGCGAATLGGVALARFNHRMPRMRGNGHAK